MRYGDAASTLADAEHRGQRVSKERRPDRDGEQRDQCDSAQRRRVSLQRPHLDAMRGVEVRADFERLFDDALHERCRFGRIARPARLHGAQQRRLE